MNWSNLPPRWMKLLRDAWLEKERVLLMCSALVASLFAIATILGAWQILRREIKVNYLSTRPAMATLEVAQGLNDSLVRWVRNRPDVAEAEAHDVLQGRVKVGDNWLPLLFFVSDSMNDLRLNRYFTNKGMWPAPTGTLLLERTALPVLETEIGSEILIKLPNIPGRTVRVAGTTHDPGLSPAYQERMGYAYVSTATLRAMGEDPSLRELRVLFRLDRPSMQEVKHRAEALATDLGMAGVVVREIRVPPFEKHPHQIQMETVLLMLLLFGVLALILSGVLVATTLSAWLARQTRELAILKTVGAGSTQIAVIYMAFVAGVGALSCAMAWPLGVAAAKIFSAQIANMLNFTLTDTSLPWSHLAILAAVGIAVPVLFAWFPIRIATRVTVRESLDDWGARVSVEGSWLARAPRVMRELLRRPRRLALSLLLLGFSGAIFLTTLNVRDGWTANLDKVWKTRHYDVEVRFRVAQADSLLRELAQVPGIASVEPWSWTPASLSQPGKIDMVQVWPDKGHGSMSLMGLPTATKLVSFPIMAGRWLHETDSAGAMMNHIAWTQAGKPAVGSVVFVGVDGEILTLKLVGVVEEAGSPGIVYVTRGAYSDFLATHGASRMIRVQTEARTPQQRTAILQNLERAMEARGLPVQMAIPFSELKTAIGDHMKVLIGALFALSAVIALVGMLGLASVTGMGVLERTREFGVMKTLGATPDKILGRVVLEVVTIGISSWVLACLLAWPLTAILGRVIGGLGFLAPLPMVFHPIGPVLWLLAAGAISLISAWIPARRAGKISVCEALAQV